MSDYGAGWPLFDDRGALEPSDLDLPAELVARLHAWQEHFEQRFHYDRGWQSTEDAVVYAREGRQLQRLLTAETDGWARVELDLWPVPPDDVSARRP
jgi:hypothetical protein